MEWNPLNWFRVEPAPELGFRSQEAERLQIEQNSVFLSLPPEMRGMILGYLTGVDHMQCRFVSRLIKYDIEQDIGIRARIVSPEMKSWHGNTFLKYVIKTRSSEQNKADKLEWLKTVRIISLDVEGLNQLPPTIGESLQSPLSLSRLILRFDESIQGGLQAFDIINRCTRLNSFQMTFEAPKRFLKWHPTPPFAAGLNYIQDYNVDLSKLLQTVLQGLSLSGTSLKSLNIRSIAELDTRPTERYHFTHNQLKLEDYYIGMPSLNQALQIELPIMLQVLDIHMIQFRNVHCPYRLSNQVHLWKALLDAQTQLTHLSVRIGSIYWRFFEVVLNNCQRSLKSVEIDVCNWHEADSTPATNPNMGMHQISSSSEIDIPVEDWFDWTVLFSQNCNLESLTIRMPPRAHCSANRTKNFCLNFGKLKKLELHFVKLKHLNVRQVLLELPELKELTMKKWYTVRLREGFETYRQRFEQTFDWIRNALELQRLDSIKLFGNLVSGNIYKFELAFRQTAFTNRNYTVNWVQSLPPFVYHYISFYEHISKPTLHLVKNT